MLGPSGRILSKTVMLTKRYASSSTTKLVEVVKDGNGISTVSMARSPVNSLNFALLSDLKDAVVNSQKDSSSGMILTSTLPSVFSAGLDIMEMYKTNPERAVKFWNALQDAWMSLYGLVIPTAAAINGSSPAGGCLLAMACEYRVMVDGKHTIGLNETQLGIVAPPWFGYSMIDTIGYRKAELALLQGKLFTPQEALEIGLIDELATDKEEAISKCQKYIASFAKIPGRARAAAKTTLRKERIAWLKNNRDKDTSTFINYVMNPEVQAGLDMYIQMLKQKSKM